MTNTDRYQVLNDLIEVTEEQADEQQGPEEIEIQEPKMRVSSFRDFIKR